ncbi:mucin-desulfating sulfatase (N-acetylglucosamine-6-sulfatase) [Rhodopirellula maiorica SM1]|uniref:Mucin-desulfating sulfatase (N-acetylglucosamine-6-sulfatase) n=1 Tax=Rhodopirellula maiorica SM1 TaxID=1265738 RepID=M5RTI7_9BACT|nr:sulfatase [Rhodopirellula maiorica]EMI18697.1 mucin-desulfating sulfatase (N-acetylglucosamine-6-sulfatase) [Rhodopirellula maiorica SM1]
MKSTLLATLFAFVVPAATQAAAPPNIVFIFTDDHCEQALSAYDPARITTPNLDRIANDGMRFDRCYVTNAICGPSRAVIQTGKYSHINGFKTNRDRFNGDQQTFPKLLKANGYQTAVVGKWHLVSTPQGYDYYDVLKGQGPYYNPPMLTAGPDGNPVMRPHTGYTTEIITEKTLNWLKEQRDPNKPFMLMCQHKAPHRNWMPSPKYLNWLDDVTIPEPETLFDDYSGRTRSASRQQMTIKEHLNSNDLKLTGYGTMNAEQRKAWDAAYGPKNEAFKKAQADMTEKEVIQWKYQRYVKDYLRCVKSVDDSVGAVLDYLDEAGLADNTVVIYSSDQGWYLGEHGWFDKRWMYEESLKTPLMVRWPGVVKPGTVNNDIVTNLDYAETFLDIAGTDIPSDMQGRSLVPIFKGNTPADWRKTFYYHYYENPGAHNVARHYGVTNGRHKLIRFYALEGEAIDDWELFDLEKDPNELNSVYANPEYASVRSEMESELARLRKHYADETIDPIQPLRKRGKQQRR